jgi:uncharacterized protein
MAAASADMTATTNDGTTALHYAANAPASVETIKWLLDIGIGVNLQDDDGFTPLFYAAREGSLELTDILLKAGADHTLKSSFGNTALLVCCHTNQPLTAQRLIEAGADIYATADDGNTALHRAAAKGNVAVIKCLLGAGAELDARNLRDNTPMFVAIAEGEYEATKLLIDEGATVVNAVNVDGDHAIHIAAWQGHSGIVKLLVDEHGCDVNLPEHNGWTSLACAVIRGHIDTVALLLSRGADVTKAVPSANCLLSVAIRQKRKDMIELLLNFCSPNTVDEDGWSPLAYAVENGDMEAVELLRGRGADINCSNDRFGSTLIHFAWDGILCRNLPWETLIQLESIGVNIAAQYDGGWRIPSVPDGFTFREVLLAFAQVIKRSRKGDAAGALSALDGLPETWRDWSKDELIVDAVLQNQAASIREYVAAGANFKSDHFGDTRVWDAYHSARDSRVLEELRLNGQSLLGFGPRRTFKTSSPSAMHAQGSMTEAAYAYLMSILEDEENDLRESDPALLEELYKVRDVEPKKFSDPTTAAWEKTAPSRTGTGILD